MGQNPSLLQSYATQNYEAHYTEEDLVQEEHRVLGECFFPSTVDSLVNSVSDFKYDPSFYIVDEGFPRSVVPYLKDEDCSIMFSDLVLPTDLWEVYEIVNVTVGAEVWAVNLSLMDGSLWGVPFVANPGPMVEEAAVKDHDFWDTLLMEDLANDLGLDSQIPVAAPTVNKGKLKLGQVPANLWDVDEDPQGVPFSGNVHNVTRSGWIF